MIFMSDMRMLVFAAVVRVVGFAVRMGMIVKIPVVPVGMGVNDDLSCAAAGATVLNADFAGSAAFRTILPGIDGFAHLLGSFFLLAVIMQPSCCHRGLLCQAPSSTSSA
jgi:hypothetical protein